MNIYENPFELTSNKYFDNELFGVNFNHINDENYQRELEKHLNELENSVVKYQDESEPSETKQNDETIDKIKDEIISDFKNNFKPEIKDKSVDESVDKTNENIQTYSDSYPELHTELDTELHTKLDTKLDTESSPIFTLEGGKKCGKKSESKKKVQKKGSKVKKAVEIEKPENKIESEEHPKEYQEKITDTSNQKNKLDYLAKKHDDFDHKSFIYKPPINDMKFINSLSYGTYFEAEFIRDEKNNENSINKKFQDYNRKIRIKDTNQITYGTTSYYKDTLNPNNEIGDIQPISEKTNMDFIAEIKNAINSSTSFLSYRETKAELVSKYPNLIDPINYFIQQAGDNSTSLLTDLFARFGETFAMYYKYQLYESYIGNKNKALTSNSFNNKPIKENFKIVKLPPELSRIIRNVNYYFKEIKDDLTLNEKTGQYNLKYKEIEYPIICKHIYMGLSGSSPLEISKVCCLNSQCKYCGDSLINYYEDLEETEIPETILSLTYKLIENTSCSDDDGMFRIIYNMFTGVISKFVNKEDPKFEDKAIAIVSLYIYKIILLMVEKNKLEATSKKTKSLINTINENCSIVGWDTTKIESLLNNEDLFTNLNLFIDLLTNEQKTDENLLETVNKIFESTSQNELKILQKENRLREFNETLMKKIIDNVNFDFVQKIVDEVKSINLTNVTPKDELYGNENNTFEVFKKIIKTYCPSNYIHEWNKNSCSKCGIKKDFSNVEDIYERYKLIINQTFDLQPSNNVSKTKILKQDSIIDNGLRQIPENEIKKYIIDRLNINENGYDKIVSHMFEIIPYLYSTIETKYHVGFEKLNKLKHEEILRIFLYIDSINPNENYIDILKYGLLTASVYIKTKTINQIELEDE